MWLFGLLLAAGIAIGVEVPHYMHWLAGTSQNNIHEGLKEPVGNSVCEA
jgi:hypothetical protein